MGREGSKGELDVGLVCLFMLCRVSITQGRVSHMMGHHLLPTIWVELIMDWGSSPCFGD